MRSAGESTKRVAQAARGDLPLIIRFFLKVLRITFCDENVDFTIGPFGSLMYGGYQHGKSDYDVQVLLKPNGKVYTEKEEEGRQIFLLSTRLTSPQHVELIIIFCGYFYHLVPTALQRCLVFSSIQSPLGASLESF